MKDKGTIICGSDHNTAYENSHMNPNIVISKEPDKILPEDWYEQLRELDKPTGKKFDNDKLRWSLLPVGTIPVILEVLELGARKYGFENFKLVENARQRYYDALMRHIDAWWTGEKVDSESGKTHLAHAACCILFLLWFELNNKFDTK